VKKGKLPFAIEITNTSTKKEKRKDSFLMVKNKISLLLSELRGIRALNKVPTYL